MTHSVKKYKVTFLVATPTFLEGYICGGARQRTLARCNICSLAPEKLQQRVALAFEDRFGIRPLVRMRMHRVFVSGDGEWRRFSRVGISPGGHSAGKNRSSATRGVRECGGHRDWVTVAPTTRNVVGQRTRRRARLSRLRDRWYTMKPKANQFVRVNTILYLGTGKVELRGVNSLVASLPYRGRRNAMWELLIKQ